MREWMKIVQGRLFLILLTALCFATSLSWAQPKPAPGVTTPSARAPLPTPTRPSSSVRNALEGIQKKAAATPKAESVPEKEEDTERLSFFARMLRPFWTLASLGGNIPLFVSLPLAAIALVCVGAAGPWFRKIRMWQVFKKYDSAGAKEYRRRATQILLALLLITAFVSTGNYLYYKGQLGEYRYGSFFNAYEFYHYYMGTKYAHELGYANLYSASLVADDETGLKFNHKSKTIRNLANGKHDLTVEKVLAQKAEYKAPFSEERWKEFVADISWFKGLKQMPTSRWSGMLRDKGYNSTPVWSMVVGGLFSNNFGTKNPREMDFLAELDLLLVVLALGAVVWAFGPRTAMLLLILLGTHYVMKWWHMKGAFLRTDFIMFLIMSICCVKKDRYRLAGGLMAWSFLSRVFPAVFLFGLGAGVFWRLPDAAQALWALKKRHPARWPLPAALIVIAHFLVAGFVCAALRLIPLEPPLDPHIPTKLLLALWPCVTVLLGIVSLFLWGLRSGAVPARYGDFFGTFGAVVASMLLLSVVYFWGRLDIWTEFAEKIGFHNSQISTWRLGFKYLFIGSFDDTLLWSTLFSEWRPKSISSWYVTHRALYWSIQASAMCFALLVARNMKDHRAFIFSFVPCFFLVSATYYYFILLLAPMLFFAAKPDRIRNAAGLVLMYGTGMAGYYFYSMKTIKDDQWKQTYGTYYWIGWLIFIMVLWMMLLALWENRGKIRAALMTAWTLAFGILLYLQWPLPKEASSKAPIAFAAVYIVGLVLLDFLPWKAASEAESDEVNDVAPA
jgi:hypothetical protein